MAKIYNFDSAKHQKTPVFQANLRVMMAYEGLGAYLEMDEADPAAVLAALDALNVAITCRAERFNGG